jgi:hypothetical protein
LLANQVAVGCLFARKPGHTPANVENFEISHCLLDLNLVWNFHVLSIALYFIGTEFILDIISTFAHSRYMTLVFPLCRLSNYPFLNLLRKNVVTSEAANFKSLLVHGQESSEN